MLRRFSRLKQRHQLIFAVVIGFAVVAFWRGSWGLMDIYLLPGNYEASFWASLLLGIAILIISHMAVKELS